MFLAEWMIISDQKSADIATKRGVSRTTVDRWVKGHREPDVETIVFFEDLTRGAVLARDWLRQTTDPVAFADALRRWKEHQSGLATGDPTKFTSLCHLSY